MFVFVEVFSVDFDDVVDVEKGVLFEVDVDESCLYVG